MDVIKFIDLHSQYQHLEKDIARCLQTVLDHGQFLMGPEISALESALAEFVGVKHCIALSNGTTALQIALMALGIGQGDEVITSAFSFFSTVEAIALLGAIPICVDIDPHTFNIDPQCIEAAITEKTKAILPVSLFGQCANLTEINAIAARHHLPVIEDAAQSMGALHYGQRSCGLTTIACTSFFPSKPLGCYGDGGACFTDDDILAQRIRLIRNHGQEERYYHVCIGTNARIDTLQAAILLVKWTVFHEECEKRQQVAQYYAKYLRGVVETPYIAPENISVYAQYTVQVANRDELRQTLAAAGIPTMVHYPRPLSQQPALAPYYMYQPACPVTETAAQRVLSLPFYPDLNEATVAKICDGLRSAIKTACVV